LLAPIAFMGIAASAGHATTTQDKTQSPQVRVCGVRIVAGPYNDEQKLRAFNMFPGTVLALEVEYPAGGLIAFDSDKSTLEKLADEKGTSLLVEQQFGRSGFSMWPRFSADQKVALIEASGGGVPARGTREIRARGTLVFRRAEKQAMAKCENVALGKGTRFEVGPFKLEVHSAGKPDWGDAPLAVTFRTKQDLDALKTVKFFDAQGKPIEAEPSGSGRFGFGGDVTYERTFSLSRKVEAATLEIVYWEDLETVEIPFDLKVGVGM